MQTSRKLTAKPTNVRSTPPHKPKSKKDQLIALLRANGGADIDRLTSSLGWLPHTVRAALTGLRKSGLSVERVAGKGDSPARYSITSKPERAR